MTDIICMGEMVIDFIPGDKAYTFIQYPGGAPANVAVAAARNGLRSGMITKVGNDDFGHFLFNVLRKEGVEILSPEMCDEAVTTLAFVTLTEEGERSFVFGRKPGADMFLRPEDVREEDLLQTTILHAGSFGLSGGISKETSVSTIEKAHSMGKIVSFDINYRNVAWNDDKDACADEVKKLLPCIDLLKVSDEEVDMLGGEDNIAALMKENDIAFVAVTRGSDGVDCHFGGDMFSVKGVKVPQVADTTGAGDAFWGGFLSKLVMLGLKSTSDLTADMIREAASYGNVSGAICVTGKGAIASLPTKEEIELFMSKQLSE